MDSKLIHGGKQLSNPDGLSKPSVSCFGVLELLLLELASGGGFRSTSNSLLQSGRMASKRDESGSNRGVLLLSGVLLWGWIGVWGGN